MRFRFFAPLRLCYIVTAIICAACALCYSAGSLAAPEFDPSGAAAVYDAVSMKAIVSYEPDAAADVAGLARLPVLLAVCDAFDGGKLSLDMPVSVSEKASRIPGPTAFLEAGEQASAGELLKCAVMISAGDATYALAEAVEAATGPFTSALNARLEALGASVRYDDISGEGVMLSCDDLARVGAALMKSESFTAWSSTYYAEFTHQDGRHTELANPNKLIKSGIGCTGVATGSSSAAGYCGVFCVDRGGTRYICAVIGERDSKSRFELATGLIDYCATTFKTNIVARKGDVIAQGVPVLGGKRDTVDIIALGDSSYITSGTTSDERIEEIPESLNAPVLHGDVVGRISIVGSGGEELAELELTVSTDVERALFSDHMMQIMGHWVSCWSSPGG